MDSDRQTPLMKAAEKGFKDVVQCLIEANARSDIMDHKGQTAISLAEKSKHTEIVTLLNNARSKSKRANDMREVIRNAARSGARGKSDSKD